MQITFSKDLFSVQVRFKDIIEKQEAAENNRKQRIEKSLEAIEIEERAIQV